MVLGAVYMLTMYQRVMLGPLTNPQNRKLRDLGGRELAVLDSLKAVELMIALSEAFGIDISPAEFERDEWATPRRIVAYMEQRVRP